MAIDANVFQNIHTYADYQKADQDFQLRKVLAQQQLQSGGIDAQSKSNVYATQILSAATATGDQNAYDNARRTLANNGIDVSIWAPDVQSGAQQAQAARLAQSPLGSLLSAGTKIDANNIAAASVTGQLDGGNKFGLPATGISALLGGNMNSMLPKLIQAESSGNPNAVSPAGAQGIAQIMPATAADPGYGVQPLQGMQNGNPATAPVVEQERFANDYLNAMQAKNGGNQQLAAASYNAGPGRVDAALRQLPTETQNYVQKVAPFVPRPQGANETLPAYKQAIQQDFEAWKTNPDVMAVQKQAEASGSESGKLNVQNSESAKKADELTKRLEMNLNSMLKLNPDVPSSGFLPGSVSTYFSQATGAHPSLADNGIGDNGTAAKAANQWDQINNQQILSEIQQFIASGGANTRINQTLDKIVQAASGIDRNDLPASREAQIKNALAEIQNKNVSAQNIAGGNQPYQAVPVQTSGTAATPPGVVSYQEYFK